MSRTLTVLDAGSSGKRNWILVPLEGQSKRGFIPSRVVIIFEFFEYSE